MTFPDSFDETPSAGHSSVSYMGVRITPQEIVFESDCLAGSHGRIRVWAGASTKEGVLQIP